MTATQISQYTTLLREQGFTPSDPSKANWIARHAGPDEVHRVFLHNDGHFSAYGADNLPVCHGDGAWELAGCF